MRIFWMKCEDYKSAINLRGVYCHEKDGKALYWGKSETGFGVRYNTGYSHWIEGSLRGGASLFIGQLEPTEDWVISSAEAFLIMNYKSEFNKIQPKIECPLRNFEHDGEIPLCISSEIK